MSLTRSLVESLESRRLMAAGFQIQFAFEASVSSTVRTQLQSAANKWQAVITGDVPDVGTGAWGAAVDDIRITARVKSIDGAGRGIAQSRPTYIRSGNKLPIAGEIEIDSADLGSSALSATLTHEISHALGFGTLWSQFPSLRTGVGGTNPQYVGTNALREYRLKAYNSSLSGVPLETTGGAGTRDVHWRESVFGNELLTGFIGGGANPLSRITVGAMADLGYQVNTNAAEAYNIPGITPPTTTQGSISGKVFNDADRDGILDSGEAGLTNRRAYLDLDKSNNLTSGDVITWLDGAGNYKFSNLNAGTYNVRIDRTGLTQLSPANGAPHIVTLGTGTNVTGRNFATVSNTTTTTTTTTPTTGTGRITGKVFNDANRNGFLDSGETGGFGGRTVYIDANRSGLRDSTDPQTTTDSSGNYTFSSVAVGTHYVRLYRGDLTQTYPSSNGSITASVTSGGTASGKNFGAYITPVYAMTLESYVAESAKKRESLVSSIV